MRILFNQIDAVVPHENSLAVQRCDACVDDQRITHVGTCPPDFKPDKTIQGAGKLLIPGLVNAHNHAAMTLLRHRADDLPFMPWLFDNILPMEARLQPDDVYWGNMLACCEMLRTGTTCYADMYFPTDEMIRAADESGMRAMISRGLIDNDEKGQVRIDQAIAEIKQHRGHERITFALSPHAPYTCSSDYVAQVVAVAKELDVPIHTHLGESRDEIAQLRETCGQTPFEYMHAAGLFELPVLAAHCVYMTESDMQLAAKHGMSVVTNPVSNLKLGNGVAPVKKMLEHGINVALGTDGAASNNSQNMLRELGYLCLLHKGVNEDAAFMPAAQGLQIATQGGAQALGLASQIGSIEPGKLADLTMLNCAQSHWTPQSNPLAALCYGAQGSDVELTMVHGEILLEHGQLTKIDEERVRYEAQHIAERLWNPM
ncbi:MAG: amidohydrolase [Oscillospiraceae bacterium]|nr:amidohydrolase [Oscillospiraceae bacterium]